jgi:hypothetical protein
MQTPLQATQVGIGAGTVEIAAWVVFVGGIVLAVLWARHLTA